MGKEINLMDLYPRSKRPIDERGALVSDENKRIAKQFGQEFFDGDRMYGYGGFSYNERFWKETVLPQTISGWYVDLISNNAPSNPVDPNT